MMFNDVQWVPTNFKTLVHIHFFGGDIGIIGKIVKFGMMLLPAGWFHMISTSPPAMETCPIEQVENVVTSEPGKKKAPTVSNPIQWNHR